MALGGRADAVLTFVIGRIALEGSTNGVVDLCAASSVRATSIAAASSP